MIVLPGFLQLAKSLWLPFERDSEGFTSELQRQSKEIKEEIRLASEQAADRERKLQIAERKSAADFRNKLLHRKPDPLSREDRAWRDQIRERESKARKQSLLDRLSTHDHVAPFKRARKKRYGSTGLWLGATDEYNRWLHSDEASNFWLSGILVRL